MKRFLRKYFTHNRPAPLIRLLPKKLSFEYKLSSFGNKNKNLIFYIIKRDVGSGFFSNLFFILNHIRIAQKFNFIPVIDMKNFKTIYNDKTKKYKNKNFWEVYFKKITKYDLKDVYKSNNVIFSSNFLPSDTVMMDWNKNNLRKIYKKYIKINPIFISKKNFFVKKNFKQKTLGVHFRGTSYKIARSHSFQPNLKIMIDLINSLIQKYNYKKIFVITEEQTYLDGLKKEFKNRLIFYESYRSYKNDAFKNYPRKDHRYKLGEEALIETLILSECNGLISNTTNIEKAAKFISQKKQMVHEIYLGTNSRNKYIARWLWYLKSLLPKKLGGLRIIKLKNYK
jgi:hypothetical protein